VFTDTGSLGRIWTRSSANVTNSTVSPLVGSSSLVINGASDYLETDSPPIPATGDWEFTFNFYINLAAGRYILTIADPTVSVAGTCFSLYVSQALGLGSTSNNIFLYASNGTTYGIVAQTTSVVTQGSPHTCSIKRQGNNLFLTVDSNNGNSGAFTGSFPQLTGRKLRIGKPEITGESGASYIKIDSFRYRIF
jgi:hypothetical protein